MTKPVPSSFRRAALVSALLLCVGCSIQSPTLFSQRRTEVVHGYYDTTIPAASFKNAQARELGTIYAKTGSGPLEITVTYDPHSRKHTARAANDEAARIGAMLQAYGIRKYKSEILPVTDAGQGMQVQVRFPSMTAQAPHDCIDAYAIDDINAEAYRSYELGCTTETYVAKQINRPADLLGKAGTEPGTGRRATNIVDTYKTGTPNPQMDAIQASGN